ncbi:MAG: ABC transporter permease, partial [Anaerobacillus sp.]
MGLPKYKERNVQAPEDLFVPLRESSYDAEMIAKPSISYWKDAWLRLSKNKLSMAGLVMLILLVLMAIFGPMLTPYSYAHQVLTDGNLPPSSEHWFGTDNLGRDMFTRTWNGARISLFVGFMAAIIDFVIGVAYGGFSG